MNNNEKRILLLRQFRYSENLATDNEGRLRSCDVVEDIVHEIQRGDKIIVDKIRSIVLDPSYDCNVRGSALETLTAAVVPRRCDILIPILKTLLEDSDDDPSVHHTAIGIYEDLDQHSRRLIRPAVEKFVGCGDHRGRYAAELLNAEAEQGAT